MAITGFDVLIGFIPGLIGLEVSDGLPPFCIVAGFAPFCIVAGFAPFAMAAPFAGFINLDGLPLDALAFDALAFESDFLVGFLDGT